MMNLSFLGKYKEFGLLLLRLGLGAAFVLHGGPKLFGGPEVWAGLGKAMAAVGIDVLPVFWGFMAAFAECFGGVFMILGLFFRPAVILLAITMTVATVKHSAETPAKPTSRWEHFMQVTIRPLELAVVFYGLIFIGPGRFSFDKE
jgi:putative oxidoreductase